MPSLVEEDELAQANAVHGLFERTTLIVGPVIGGVLISVAGTWVVLGFNALTFVLAAFTVLVAPKTVRASGGSFTDRDSPADRRGPATLSYGGVLVVGLPVPATSMGGAGALGLMVAGWGARQLGGALAGFVTGLPRR